VTNDDRLTQELSDIVAELAELRSRADTLTALAEDDYYWSLCIREKRLRRLLADQLASV